MKPITGQYECSHQSGVGLDYFTSRIDRLTLLPTGRFTLIVQDRSRLANAAQSLLSGQQVTATAPETRHEGSYTQQGNSVFFHFDDGKQQQAQLSWNGEGLQIGQDFFHKVSDSTVLPPTHRLKKDMDDIAKGLKIAGTIGSIAIKAAKNIHDVIQTTQEPGPNAVPPAQQNQQNVPPSVPPQPTQTPPPIAAPAQPIQPVRPAAPPPVQQAAPPQAPLQGQVETLFCDQCGARCRPGKRFCSQCGARLP
jgi:hypothetical protein